MARGVYLNFGMFLNSKYMFSSFLLSFTDTVNLQNFLRTGELLLLTLWCEIWRDTGELLLLTLWCEI
jgi:hypothetical protein